MATVRSEEAAPAVSSFRDAGLGAATVVAEPAC